MHSRPYHEAQVLTAAECQTEADRIAATLAETIINCPKMRRYLKREMRSWQRLAEER